MVLVVEDSEKEVRTIVAAWREGNLSHEIVSIATGDEARVFLMSERGRGGRSKVRIVLLNIHSSRVCGLEFLDWLREQGYFSELLVVALAERSQLRDVVKSYERGAHTFFVKPVHVEDVKMLAKNYPDFCSPE